MITKDKVEAAQNEWLKGIIRIGELKDDREKCEEYTRKFISRMYGFDKYAVLFKPTKTSQIQFRNSFEGALSYFIAGFEQFPEDRGFALRPWVKIEFENSGMILDENRALAMGNYYFEDAEGNSIKVEYTFGYKMNDEGELLIDLHHSSIPCCSQMEAA